MKKVLVRGPALSQSGYGEHTRLVLRALRSREEELDLYLISTSWGATNWIFEDDEERKWLDQLINKTLPILEQQKQNPQIPLFDMSLQVTIPNELTRLSSQNILYTAGIETDRACPLWVAKCHELANKIIVISEHAKKGLLTPIKAQDQFGYSAIQREFTITVSDPDEKLYSNIYVQPFMKETKRRQYIDFINNGEIFNPDYIYRPNDPNFGLQRKLKMLLYSGIETKAVQEYVAAAAKNHTRKKLKFGEVKTAIAKTPGTNNIVYEVVYVEMIDPYESSKGEVKKQIKIKNKSKQLVNSIKYTAKDELYDALPNVFKIETRSGDVDVDFGTALNIYLRDYLVTYPVGSRLTLDLQDGSEIVVSFTPGTPVSNKYRPDPANTITTDSNAITVDGAADDVRYISNISHMRDAIKGLGETERNFLPLWMRTAQLDSVNELGFVNAIPLVYCKPGTSQIIKNTIDFYEIDFTQYEFDMDRYIIDSTEGNSDEQYILFANYKFNI